jgi:uncharacterized protein (DUF1810 family)
VPEQQQDPFSLGRFLEAQDADATYERALAELRAGHKRSHWMWFVFPQLAGLGTSAMAQRYAIASLEEARAYVAHPLLGARLRESAGALLELATTDPVAVLGPVDTLKLRSSMTLFARAAPDERPFTSVLARYFAGAPDPLTQELLDASG